MQNRTPLIELYQNYLLIFDHKDCSQTKSQSYIIKLYHFYYKLISADQQMYLHIGTYSGHVISFQGMIDNLTQLHNFQASQSSIRSMARSSKFLLVGGYDQLLHIYSVATNTQQGQINCQQGALNKIRIVGDMFLTGGEDGSVCVWKLGSWERVHKSKQHKSIETMDVHPSGKVMITTGKERKLILWNLLKFLRVLDIKLAYDVKKVLFYKDNILVISDNSINYLDTANNTTIKKTQQKSKIQDCLVYKEYIVTSHQNGDIKIYSAEDYSLHHSFSNGKNRVKCLGLVDLQSHELLVSADSEGDVRFWHLPSLILKQFENVEQCIVLVKRVGQRILCISAGMEFQENEYEGGEEELQQNEVNEAEAQQKQEEIEEMKAKKTKKIKKIKQINNDKIGSKKQKYSEHKQKDNKFRKEKPQIDNRKFKKPFKR